MSERTAELAGGGLRRPTDILTDRDILFRVQDMLQHGGVESAPLEASLIIAEAQGVSAGYPYADRPLSARQRQRALALAERRASGVPLAYLLGRKEFMSLDIEVDERVMIPRPETEVLVEAAERWAAVLGKPVTYIDVGTGSGNIAVALLARDGKARAVALDIDAGTLAVARRNAENHGVLGRCRLVCGDLFTGLRGAFKGDVIVCNPPYIASDEFESLPREVRDHEPRIALYGGEDGLHFYRKLAEQVPSHLESSEFLVVEVGFAQADTAAGILSSRGMNVVEIVKDLAGVERVVVARKN